MGDKVAKAQKERDDALHGLFDAMSDALTYCERFDLMARHAQDIALVSQVAKKTKQCAKFISNYAKRTSFGLSRSSSHQHAASC